MKKSMIFMGVLVFAAGMLIVSCAKKEKSIEGIWLGSLKIGNVKLQIVLNVKKEQDGTWKATMDSPDQGAKDIPVDVFTYEKGQMHAEVKISAAVFDGTMAEDGTTMQVTLKQGGGEFPLEMKKVEEAPKVVRFQDPKKPYPYLEEEVSYANPAAGITLAGTLTKPKEGDPFPAVVLITGSGAQDRNEEVMGHRPFLVLADYLTRRGIAVLRVDDRGVGGSTGKIADATSEDFAGDVLAGVNFLKGRSDINPEKIGLIGHSEGGIIAPICASRSKDVAFIVLMAGTGLTGEQILYLQSALIAKANGATDEDVARNRKEQEQIFSLVKKEKDEAVLKQKLTALLKEMLAKRSQKEKKALGNLDLYIKNQVRSSTSRWFRYFLTYDPKTALRKVICLVLAIDGEKDLQVPPKENLAAIEDALKEAGNTHYTIKLLPGLNHLFQKAQTGSPTNYARIAETINPEALKTIGDWILAQVGSTAE